MTAFCYSAQKAAETEIATCLRLRKVQKIPRCAFFTPSFCAENAFLFFQVLPMIQTMGMPLMAEVSTPAILFEIKTASKCSRLKLELILDRFVLK